MPLTGPVSEQAWGKIWTRAYINEDFRKNTLEISPRDAIQVYFGDFYEPLFDAEGPMAPDVVCNVYKELEKIRDRPGGTGKAMLRDLRDGVTPNHPDIQRIVDLMDGNEWLLIKKINGGAAAVPKIIYRRRHPTEGFPNALSIQQWARVYAEAVLTESLPSPNFKDKLRKDPTAAVDEFETRYGSFHTKGKRTLALESIDDLTDLATAGLTKAMLVGILDDIDNNIPSDYETVLKVCLSC